MYYLTKDELYHHGILGQKWGQRRYQNEDGSLTPEGKKRYYNSDGSYRYDSFYARKYHARKRKEIINKDVNYSNEFDKTSSGKKLKEEHDRAYEKYFNYHGDNQKLENTYEKKFTEAEHKYLAATGEYVAKKLINDIGENEFKYYVTNGKRTDESVNDLIKRYSNQYANIHSV